MTNLIIICTLLTVPWLIGIAIERVYKRAGSAKFGGVTGLCLAYCFFGVGHFIQTDVLVLMLPELVPLRRELILGTGVLEFLIAILLLPAATRRFAGWMSIAVLIAFFPANIYAAVNQVSVGGHEWGLVYLLLRAPLQILLIFWSYRFAIRARAA